jgi:hypothetical protein
MFFFRKVSFLNGTHCQFRSVRQRIKQTYLYMWYHLFLFPWDRCDQ